MVKWSNHRDLEAVSSLKCQVLSWRTRVESFGSSYLILSGERRPPKANRAKRTQFFDCGFRKACGPPPECARPGCTNKPNWAEPIMRNKPNSAGRPGPRRAKRAKRSQFFNCGLRISDCGLGTDLRRDAGPAACRLQPTEAKRRKTNPIPGGAGWDEVWGPMMQNEANLSLRVRKWARTGGREPPRGSIVQNKPNFRRAGRGRRSSFPAPRPSGLPRAGCAKQSQFAAEGQGRPSPRACPERSRWAKGLDAATPEGGKRASNKANCRDRTACFVHL